MVIVLDEINSPCSLIEALEAESAELRERAETIRLALRKRVVDAGEYSYSSPSWREFEGRRFDKIHPPFNQADEEGGA